ncbi:MAG TPA: tetratricopeptide repeat protein [Bacteroidia bacterium]|nr:tetratricopeptide repeat protein [Bacteroidia bacterium]
MSGKNQKNNRPSPKPVATKIQDGSVSYKWGLLAGVLLITFCCYFYSLSNQFTNWDDGYYVVKNQFIKSLSSENLKMLLFHNITNNYFHPLTMLSLAINYHFEGLNPTSYYFTNIFIHLINTGFIFWLVVLLINAMVKAGYKPVKGVHWLAAVCALWHGVHPMHVESVAWISERKDVLYALFYLSGLISYLFYLENNKVTQYILMVLLFILSLLSKPMAVVFPLSLLSIDILFKRKNLKGLILEKMPLLIVSIIGGIITFKMAASGGSVTSFEALSIPNRILFASYGYTMYLLKFLFPFKLSTFYPYPDLDIGSSLPPVFYVMPILAILLSAIPFYFKMKKKEDLYRVSLFGLSFYFFNIVFVLQFVSAGAAIMADRYSYVSYFGLIFMTVYLVNNLLTNKPKLKNTVIGVLGGVSLFFTILCYGRTKVWHDAESLWTDVLSKYPGSGSQIAYMNLGDFYAEKGDTANAFKNYSILVGMNTKLPTVYQNIGNIYAMRGEMQKSLDAYSTALSINDSVVTIYVNRAVTYAKLGRNDLAVKDWTSAIKLMPNEALYYFSRAGAEMGTNSFNAAIGDYLHDLQLEPANSTCMFNLSIAYHSVNDNVDALKYAQMAQSAGYKLPDGYLNILK